MKVKTMYVRIRRSTDGRLFAIIVGSMGSPYGGTHITFRRKVITDVQVLKGMVQDRYASLVDSIEFEGPD